MLKENTIVVKKYRERNSFSTDVDGKGKFAENDFIKYFNNNPKNSSKKLFDVSGIREYQKKDIDFVIDNMGEDVLPDINTVFANPDRYKKVEVKYNGPALRTGRYAYEFISHGRPGWAAISECDFVYTVFGEEIGYKSYRVVKRGIIYFQKWKKYVEDNLDKTELLSDRKPKVYKMRNEEENILNYLTQLEDMEKEGIFRYI
jgi:hypothetical protein